jgi:hypothetical protein
LKTLKLQNQQKKHLIELVTAAVRHTERKQQQEQVSAENNKNLSLHEPKTFSVFANFDALTASLEFKRKFLKLVIRRLFYLLLLFLFNKRL